MCVCVCVLSWRVQERQLAERLQLARVVAVRSSEGAGSPGREGRREGGWVWWWGERV